MKFTRSAKIVTFLLLAVFLLTSAGNLLGYAWCVGDDGHVEVSYATGRDCCDDGQEQGATEQYDVPTISQASGDSCGLCLDFSTQQCEAVFFKRIKRTSTASLVPLSANNSLPSAMQSVKLVAAVPLPQPPLRVAQAILSQRTVVLLN
ncbi:MAG: hypothetical protein KAU27_02910 [Desulfuromonadales bacterium]|nr:hypothetical protein [Desulfuromonadales bacterium]